MAVTTTCSFPHDAGAPNVDPRGGNIFQCQFCGERFKGRGAPIATTENVQESKDEETEVHED